MSKGAQEYTEIEHYLATEREAAYPEEQMDYFVRAELVLQPRQLVASAAAARLCDKLDGPTAIGYGGARGGGKSHWLSHQRQNPLPAAEWASHPVPLAERRSRSAPSPASAEANCQKYRRYRVWFQPRQRWLISGWRGGTTAQWGKAGWPLAKSGLPLHGRRWAFASCRPGDSGAKGRECGVK